MFYRNIYYSAHGYSGSYIKHSIFLCRGPSLQHTPLNSITFMFFFLLMFCRFLLFVTSQAILMIWKSVHTVHETVYDLSPVMFSYYICSKYWSCTKTKWLMPFKVTLGQQFFLTTNSRWILKQSQIADGSQKSNFLKDQSSKTWLQIYCSYFLKGYIGNFFWVSNGIVKLIID